MRRIDPSEYKTKFFLENGFVRKTCPICGGHFWTLDKSRVTCGDVECEGEYRFIKNINPVDEWNIHNTIAKWIKFFKDRGHEVLDYYPVVARWRDDIYFTIASIALFQPWVTDGIVDPPANPLVVPQPCIRFGGEFSDIDRIGRTGRHLSSFTMGGQHAFLSEKWKGGYWKERYLQLNFEFMTKVLEVPPTELTYKEDWWQGGGNAGPSIETFAYGLEVVNGVFMQYKYVNGALKPIPIRVLDVGWGLERIAWLKQGTPTIYEATFGPVYLWMRKYVDIDIDQKLLLKYGRYVGIIRTETQELFDETRRKLAEILELDYNEFLRLFSRLEAIYAILDHVKTVVMAIPDGGIPANVGGAANLRAILRRALSLSEKNDIEIDWRELIYRIIEYFSKTFHRIKDISRVATDLWFYETERFHETIERAMRELRRLIKKKKLRVIDDDILAMFYRNYGVPPEEVETMVHKLGLKVDVNVSPNFYEKIRIDSKETKTTKEREEREFKYYEEVVKLPETKMIFYDDPYVKEFTAKILFARDNYLVLDQTAFYPVGGGQQHDQGEIILEDSNTRWRVVRVFKINKVVVHQIDTNISSDIEGMNIKGVIDWDRRIALMRHHTATHIINGAAQRVLGPHVWQMGAEKRPDKAHLDISHYKNLTIEEIMEIERLANKIVLEDRQIDLKFMPRTEAEKKYGVRIYQGGAVPSAILRIVDIKDWDVEACGGTHLTRTSLVGPIRILGSKKIHDGIIRLEFVAGEEAVRYTQLESKYLIDACRVLRVQPENLSKVVERFFVEWKKQKDELAKLWKILAKLAPNMIKEHIYNWNNKQIVLMRLDVDLNNLLAVAKNIQKQGEFEGVLLVSTSLGENIYVAMGKQGFLELVKAEVDALGGETRMIKNGLLGRLRAPADNLIIKLKKRMNIAK